MNKSPDAGSGSNVVVLPTEAIDTLDRMAALAGVASRDLFVELLVEGLEAGDFWDEVLAATPLPTDDGRG